VTATVGWVGAATVVGALGAVIVGLVDTGGNGCGGGGCGAGGGTTGACELGTTIGSVVTGSVAGAVATVVGELDAGAGAGLATDVTTVEVTRLRRTRLADRLDLLCALTCFCPLRFLVRAASLACGTTNSMLTAPTSTIPGNFLGPLTERFWLRETRIMNSTVRIAHCQCKHERLPNWSMGRGISRAVRMSRCSRCAVVVQVAQLCNK
jgi:hypothetical protein